MPALRFGRKPVCAAAAGAPKRDLDDAVAFMNDPPAPARGVSARFSLSCESASAMVLPSRRYEVRSRVARNSHPTSLGVLDVRARHDTCARDGRAARARVPLFRRARGRNGFVGNFRDSCLGNVRRDKSAAPNPEIGSYFFVFLRSEARLKRHTKGDSKRLRVEANLQRLPVGQMVESC